mgnify:CR=1 FL=1
MKDTDTTIDHSAMAALIPALDRAAVRHSPSELHGVICGLLSSTLQLSAPALLEALAAHCGRSEGLPEPAASLLIELRDQALMAFDGDGLDLALLLPDDDEDLGLRTAALAQWCEGFLAGFGVGSAGVSDQALPAAVQESLADLAAVSQVETPAEQGEEEEALFSQVAEHCRMAALMVFTEWQLRSRQQQAAAQSVLH